MTYFYTDEKVQASLEKHYSACHEEPTQSSPALEIEEGFILSPKIVRNERGILTWEAGVFDKQKQYVPNTSMREIPFENLTFPTNCEQVDKTVIWGGLLYDHYGHFLLQSTTRLYYYLKHNPNNFPIVFAVYNTKIARYIWDFFELCHIAKDKVIFLDKTTQFKKIICPPISMEYEKNYNSNFLLPFRTAAASIQPAQYKKIYFSRKHWHGVAKCLGEEQLEKVFNKNGFHSVYMERLTLREQIAVIKGAEELAGINGTAFHNILFDEKPKTVILLHRNEQSDGQYMINESTGSRCYLVQAYANPLPVMHAKGPFIVGVTPFVKQFLKDYGLNDFGISFNPAKYVHQFLVRYVITYHDPDHYKGLVFFHKDKIDAENVIYLLHFTLIPTLMYYGCWFFSKITFGRIRELFKIKYEKFKRYREKIIFKY